jgi:hypothetical protein
MPIRRTQIARRAALASCVAFAALNASAFAKDLPPSPDGAAKLQAFFATYLGKSAPLTITPADPGFWAAFDLAALTAPMKTAGFTFDPATVKYRLVEQDDGAWRAEFSDFPTLVAHIHRQDGGQTLDGTETIAFAGAKGQALIDPAIGFWRSLSGGADSANAEVKFPGVDEYLQVAAFKVSGTGRAGADGAVSAVMTETATSAELKFDIDPRAIKAAKANADAPATDAQPFSVDVNTGQVSADVKLDGLKTRPLLDLWGFLVAHPSRAELAANEAAFKALLAAALASPVKIDESATFDKITAQIPQGQVTIDSTKFGASGASGSAGAFGERFEANGLTLPASLIPAPFVGFAPTSFAIGFRASGFDVAAAGAEAIADLRLAGDGPVISPDDGAKIRAKLIGPNGIVVDPAGIVVDIEPSHIVAPLFDISFDGQIVYKGAKPTGKLTVHMRDFDKTQAALKTLGPEVEKKIAPALAMARGLAKADGDGSLVWVGEIGADGVMKVNGLPLGKSPI